MNRIKKVFRLVHIVLWILFTSLVVLQLSTDGHPYGLTLATVFILTCLYVFYGHFYLLTNYRSKGKKKTYIVSVVALVVTGPVVMLLLYLVRSEPAPVLFESYRIHLATTVPVFLFLSWLARVTENLVLNTIRKEQLEKQAVESELSYLKAQINPHFLFNTLNNIHTLVYKQAPTAPEAVLRLSSLMRYMIYESNAHVVPLAREMTYLHDYIGLQQLRYKNASVVNLTTRGDTGNCFVAPLLFIHFLENAYKHSPARLESGAIRVTIEVTEKTLVFTCENPVAVKHGKTLDEPGGIGLPNIRKRLGLLYPDAHRLEISNTGERFTTTLTIQGLHLQLHERKADLLYH